MNTANLLSACAKRELMKYRRAGVCVLLWIDQNRPMEKKLLSALFWKEQCGESKKPEWTNTKSTTTTTPSINKKNNNLQKKETSPTRWNTAKLTDCVCETTSWWNRQAGGCVLLWISQKIVQWRKTFCQHSLKRTVWGINKTRMNNHINTFYNQKEQQSAKKRNITDEMEHSQTYILRVRDDELMKKETGRRICVPG